MALILDTGPVLAALDRSDVHHTACKSLIEGCGENLVVVAPTLVEIDYWIRKRSQPSVWRSFVEDIALGVYELFHPDLEDLTRAAELEAQYADLGLGLVDATVIAACETYREEKVATLDHRHFAAVRPRHCTALRLLPERG